MSQVWSEKLGSAADSLACVRDKRIVLISHDLTQTGSPLLLVETAVWLREAGAQVQIATIADDADVHDLPRRHGIALLPIRKSFAKCASADLVIANTAEAVPWVDSYLREHPGAARSLLWWIHEIDASSYADRMHSLSRASMSIFDSHASLENWKNTGLELPPITRVVHLCVEDAFLEEASRWRLAHPGAGRRTARDATRAGLGLAPRDFVITLIGTYQARKGHDLLVKTVRGMVDREPDLPLKLILVGFLSEAERRDFMRRLGGPDQTALDDRRAVLVARDLARYYAASDAFVMNTQDFGEAFGRVTIEAMAFGLPVLGTDAGGTPEIVENGVTGLLHPVGGAGQDRLAKNIRVLLEDRPLAKTMGNAGLERVKERFTSARFRAEFGVLLQIALAAKPRGQRSRDWESPTS